MKVRQFISLPLRPLMVMLLGLLCPGLAWGQSGDSPASGGSPSLLIGVGGGYETMGPIAQHLYCGCGGAPDAMAESATAHIELILPRLFGRYVGLRGRLEGSKGWLGAGSSYEDPNAQVLLRGNTERVTTPVLMESKLTIYALQLDLLGTVRLPFGLVADLGVFIGGRGFYDHSITAALISPADSAFAEPGWTSPGGDERVQFLWGAPDITRKPWRFGGLMLLSYPIGLGGGFGVTPELRLRADLIDPFEGEKALRTFNPGAGLSFTYAPAYEAASAPPPTSSLLPASIDIYAVAGDGSPVQEATVRNGSVARRRSITLPSRLVFDTDADLPARYIRLAPSALPGFTLDSAARLDPIAIERQLPNIIGARMRSDRSTLRLTASVLPGESDGAARGRAESLRRYLTETWGIAVGRVTIATEPGEERVVRANGEAVTSALETRWSERRVEVSPVRVSPQADADLQRWRIRLLRDGRQIASQRSDEPAGSIDLAMLVGDLRRDASRSPLVAEFEVEDSLGRVSMARDELPFRFEESAPGNTIEYLLLDERSRDESLRRIASELEPGYHLVVTPISPMEMRAAEDAAERLRVLLGERGAGARIDLSPATDGEGSATGFSSGGVRVVAEPGN